VFLEWQIYPRKGRGTYIGRRYESALTQSGFKGYHYSMILDSPVTVFLTA